MGKIKNLVGQRFGRLEVIKFVGYAPNKNCKKAYTLWLCKCDCGNTKVVRRNLLTRGYTTSCGCYKLECLTASKSTHKMSKSRIYRIHNLMKYRCYSEKCEQYKYYGGKGIKMSDDWIGNNGFINFYNWAINNGYTEKLTIERVDVNGNYEPNNCIWIPQSEQCRNRTNTHFISYENVVYTLSELSEKVGIDRATIRKYEKLYPEYLEEILNYIVKRRSDGKQRVRDIDKFVEKIKLKVEVL